MDMKQWVENWKRVGPILEQIKAEELRAPDYHKQLEGLLPMCDLACAQAAPSKTRMLSITTLWSPSLRSSKMSLIGESVGLTLPKSSISGDTEIDRCTGTDFSEHPVAMKARGIKSNRNQTEAKRHCVFSIFDKLRKEPK